MGCKQYKGNPDKEQAITTIYINPEINRKIGLDDLYSDYQFIRLETNTNALIGFVDKLEIFHDRIYIFNRSASGSSIFCFNNQGKFLYKIANHGQGPGETVFMMDFSINKNNNTLWIGDDARKILEYDLDGHFIKEYRTGFSINNIACIDSNDDLFAIRFGYYKDKNYGFAIYSLQNDRAIAHRMYASDFERICGGESMSFCGKNLLYGFGFTDTLFQVTNQNFIPLYALDFGKHRIPKEMYSNKISKNFIAEINKPSNEYAGLITRAIENESYLKFMYSFCGKNQISVYSKSRKKIINISNVLIDDKENDISQFLIHNEGDTCFSIIYPHQLIDTYDEGANQVELYGICKNVNQLKSELKPDDNPVVIVGKINYNLLFK